MKTTSQRKYKRGQIRFSFLIVLFLCFLQSSLFAQQSGKVNISGVVTDANNESLAGVTIQIKDVTGVGWISDIHGKFNCHVEKGQTILFSYTGFSTKEYVVGNSTSSLHIKMKETTQDLSEIVVIGYGTQKKTSLTASVSTMKGENISQQPVGDLTNTLGGRVAGIFSTQAGGEPGADNANLLIRGISTTGSTSPLVIVDGVPRNFSRLDPNTIQTVTVLKDAAAVASYGMAGANGVILVTTKTGEKGKAKLSYNAYYGWQNPTKLTEFANSYEYASLFNMANDNMGQPRRYTEEELQKFKDGSDPLNYPNHNVLKELISRNAPLTSHTVQVSGGGEKVDYFLSFNYLYQGGMWKPTNMNKYNLISKINVQATNTTKIELSITGRLEQFQQSGVASTGGTDIFYQAFRTPPTAPLVYPNGLPGEHEGRSVYAQVFNSGFNKQKYYVMYNQVTIEQQLPFLKGLSLKGMAAYDIRPTQYKLWQTPMDYYMVDTSDETPEYILSGTDGPAKPALTESRREDESLNIQGHIVYKNTFGKHDINGLVVFEAWNTKYGTLGATRLNYNVGIPEIDNGSSDPADLANSGTSGETKQRSIIYRVAYGYDNKYLIETAGRYDGSYSFAPGHRFGFFPSVSLAWRIAEEPFLKDRAKWLSNLKLRASYGESGALAAGPFQYLSSYALYSNSAIISGQPTQGLYETKEPNTSITWERAKKIDVGIDLGIFNNKLDFTADVFFERRNNMLVSPQVSVPFEYGIGIAQENKGKMENRGVEFSLNFTHSINKDWSVGFQTNFTYAKNKIVEIFETPSTYDNPNRRKTGRPLGTKFGYKALGYFQVSDDLNGDGIINEQDGYNVKAPWGTVRPGDLKYRDTNDDKKLTVDDMVPIGHSDIPEIIYGFSPSIRYKWFDLSLFFQGVGNRDIYLEKEAAWPFENKASVPITALDVWTPDNPNARNPRVTPQPTQNNTQTSSWWVENAGYLRLKSGELGFTFPQELLYKMNIQSLRVYISGQNLLTWTKLKNFDPEASSSRGFFYPHQRVISIGVNIDF